METKATTATREPLPPYDPDGEAGGKPEATLTDQAAGPEPRPITAAEARRRRLWEQGILVLEGDSYGKGNGHIVGPIDEALTTEEVPSNPRREGQRFRLRPEQELMFVPSGPEQATAEWPPLRVHRRRTIVRVRPDTAKRYGDLYKLLMAAECIPNAVGEALDRLTWAHIYDSIRTAKKVERILQEASRFAG